MSEEIESRVTEKMSQGSSMTESCIFGALSRLNDFFQNPQARAHSGPVPEISRISSRRNLGTNEESSQNDSHPGVRISSSQSTQDISPEETSYIVIVDQE